MLRAVTVGDLAYARTQRFQSRVNRALAAVEAAAARGKIGVSYSGGKDSTCTLHVVRQIAPDVATAFYDSGCEHPGTYEMVEHYHVATIRPQMSLPEMCRYGGYWGYATPTDRDARFAFFDWLVAEPSERFVAENGLQVMAMGLRAGESSGRRMSARKRGELYRVKSGLWHLCPLAVWEDDDVWGYIASQDLRYNAAYDRMAQSGLPRRAWRVGLLLGICAANMGRLAWLRQTEPELWRALYAEFPLIARYT